MELEDTVTYTLWSYNLDDEGTGSWQRASVWETEDYEVAARNARELNDYAARYKESKAFFVMEHRTTYTPL